MLLLNYDSMAVKTNVGGRCRVDQQHFSAQESNAFALHKRCLHNKIFHNTNWLAGKQFHIDKLRLSYPEDWQCLLHLDSSDCIIWPEKKKKNNLLSFIPV